MDYPKEQLWELYKSIPEDLQEALFSEKTANQIYNTCIKNEVKDEEKIKEVSKHIGYVLLGIIPPDGLSAVLKKEVKLKELPAERIAREINQSLFSDLRKSLEELYDIEIEKEAEEEKIEQTEETEQTKPQELKTDDEYRELIE